MLRRVVIIAALFGCGRLSFDASADASGSGDGSAPLSCIAGYLSIDGGCYRVETANDLDWLAAESRCEADGAGAHLVTIDDAAELALVDTLVTVTEAWIGTSDRVVPETYLTVTGRPAFLRWDVNQPDDSGGPEYCITLQGMHMHDDDCPVANDFVCEYDAVAVDPTAF